MQVKISFRGAIRKANEFVSAYGIKKALVVCGKSFDKSLFDDLVAEKAYFLDFAPNPSYNDISKGIKLFAAEKCDSLIAVGGGSAIDTAKCIKHAVAYNKNIPFMAVPTTGGSGSESTRYAVYYKNGTKQTLTSDGIIPDYVILDGELLSTLPTYQKKCTLLDALCQAVESLWSVNSTDESKNYAETAIRDILSNYKKYCYQNDANAAQKIIVASNYSGMAINISQTTAAHAMSYKLTSLYGIPHGHAVAVGLPHIWRYIKENTDKCTDKRGSEYLRGALERIAKSFEKIGSDEIAVFENLLKELDIYAPQISADDVEILTKSVNIERLKNTPVYTDETVIKELYARIAGSEKK